MICKLKLVWLIVLSVSVLLACQQQDPQQNSTVSGYVEATNAYLLHFGEPPQGKKGLGFARVAYLPLKSNPDMVRPLPVYLFSEGFHLPKILDRLAGEELILPADTALYKPFPDDLKIIAEPPINGVQNITLQSKQSWDTKDLKATGLAFAETALQFLDTEKVYLTVNGQPLPSMPSDGYTHNSGIVAAMGAPELVLIAGAWESGDEHTSELMIEFDRPISIDSFKLSGPDGEKVEGEYYTSIFQMAVIVHPSDPRQFREGVELTAEWSVVDKLGRSGSGRSTLPLHRYDH